MGKPVTLGIVGIICLIALVATDRMAVGQAGSIGGTIGKTDKSVSGGEEERPTGRKSGHRQAATTRATISGKWSWRAKCENGTNWTGEFYFDQNADGTLTGSCRVISGPGNCGALSGRVAGNKATLTVRQTGIGEHENASEFSIAADG